MIINGYSVTYVLGITLTFWGITFLCMHYKHKRNIKRIKKKIEERVNRPLDEQERIDRQWDEVNGMWQTVRPLDGPDWYWQRGRLFPLPLPYDEIRPKTDKLSPKKRMKVHKIDQEIRKETFVSPRLSYGKWRDRQ